MTGTAVAATGTAMTAATGTASANYLHQSWMDYLYWDTELEP